MIKAKRIKYDKIEFKSKLEFYFYIYLEELKNSGYILDFGYERHTFKLSDSIYLPYKQQLKTKIKDSEEFMLIECTYTPDFDITWSKKALNVFYLDNNIPILNLKGDIPFRLHKSGTMVSYIEVKPMNESKLDSSKEFPTLAKWVYQKYNSIVQKIKPLDNYGKNCLFQTTFTPQKVIHNEVYLRDCKYGLKGATKLKYKYKTLWEYLN